MKTFNSLISYSLEPGCFPALRNKAVPGHNIPRIDQIRLDQIRLDQIRSDQIRLNQIRSDQIRLDQIKSDQIRLNQIRSDQIRLDQIRLEQIKLDQIRSEQIRLEQNRIPLHLTYLTPTPLFQMFFYFIFCFILKMFECKGLPTKNETSKMTLPN